MVVQNNGTLVLSQIVREQAFLLDISALVKDLKFFRALSTFATVSMLSSLSELLFSLTVLLQSFVAWHRKTFLPIIF